MAAQPLDRKKKTFTAGRTAPVCRNPPTLPFALALLAAAVALPAQQQTAASLTIDLSKPLHPVSPMLYGLMTEEINFSYDGGLYAEMVRNRTFAERDLSHPRSLVPRAGRQRRGGHAA